MIAKIYFTKMQALGNDFVVINALTQTINLENRLARQLANRHFGIGCDQILVLEAPRDLNEDFFYRIFNADGTEVAQCGNGARCIGRFIYENGFSQKPVLTLGTQNKRIRLAWTPPHITAYLSKPEIFHLHQPLPFADTIKHAVVLNLGNPHCVFSVPNIHEVDLPAVALGIEKSHFFPQGVNIGVMQILAKNHIKLRVFERGAGETLSCGSGACAAVAAGISTQMLATQVQVEMQGGTMQGQWDSQQDDIALSGETKCVFDGFFVVKKHY